jgi:CopG family nickel-responsive transcriptional regulator
MTVVSLSLDGDLLERFDDIWEQEGFQNRSEALRSAMRDFIYTYGVHSYDDSEIVEVRLVYSYHDTARIRKRLSQVEHEHEELIFEKQHKHVTGDLCFDMLTLQGPKTALQPVIARLRSVRGIETFHSIVLLLSHHHGT